MSRSKKKKLTPATADRKGGDALRRRYRKVILFNEKELSFIDQYCRKYSIGNRSALFRNIIISHILEQIDDNYPKLF